MALGWAWNSVILPSSTRMKLVLRTCDLLAGGRKPPTTSPRHARTAMPVHFGNSASRPLTRHTEVGGVATGTNCSSTPQHYPNHPVAHHPDWSIQPLQ